MKKLITISLLSLFLATPFFTFAATPAGLTPKSPFYFLDTLFERINLALTFNPEKKVTKALLFAEERLAEVGTSAEDEKPEVIGSLMSNYQANVSLATEKSKEVKDEKKAEELFNKIVDNTAKHQEVLIEVLAKVPEVAKEAIEKALEASKKGHEEALKQVAELKQEVTQLKKEIVELKQGNNKNRFDRDVNQATEIEKLKQEVSELKNKQSSSVSTQVPTTPAKLIMEQNPGNRGINFLEPKINNYKLMVEAAEGRVKRLKNYDIDDDSFFKDRRANLVYRLNYAKQLNLIPGYDYLNNLISLYWQAFEKDIREIDENIFGAIESRIPLANRDREESERKLSLLLANPNRFVSREEFVEFGENEFVPFMVKSNFEDIEYINNAKKKYLGSVGAKEDQYTMMKTTITNSLSNNINQLNAVLNYSQPANAYSNSNYEYERARADQIVREIQENVRALDKTTCTFNLGPSGGFEYSTMTCN